MPNNIVKMVTSESELRYIYFMVAFLPALSAFLGFSLARGSDGWMEVVVRIGSIAAYCAVLVLVFKSRFKLWQTKGDLFQ